MKHRIFLALVTALTALLLVSGTCCLAEVQGGVGYRSGLDVRDRAGRSLRFGSTVTSVSYGTSSSGVKWSISAVYVRPDEHLVYDGGGWTVRIPSRVPSTMVGAHASTLDERLGLGCWWEGDRARQISKGIFLTITPVRQIGASLKRETRQFLPWSSEAHYFSGGESEGGMIRWDALADVTTLSLVLHPIEVVSVTSFASEARSPGRPGERRGQLGGGYDFILGGSAQHRGLSADWRLTRTLTLAGHYQKLRLRSQLLGYAELEQFAHFGIVDADAVWWGWDLRKGRTVIGLAAGRAVANLAGVVEAGPFLHDLRVLLGARQQIVGEGSVRWLEGRCGGGVFRSSRLGTDWQLELFHLRPQAVVTTWTTTFGFDMSDLKHRELDISRATLARVSIAPEFEWGVVTLRAAVSQWIPLSVSRRSNSNNSSQPADVTGNPSIKSQPWTGFNFEFSLRARL
jgi:hypothetical protein